MCFATYVVSKHVGWKLIYEFQDSRIALAVNLNVAAVKLGLNPLEQILADSTGDLDNKLPAEDAAESD
jgi:hypothetical protein